MVKEGVFGSVDEGWEVFIKGKLTGWFKHKGEAEKAFKNELSKIAESVSAAKAAVAPEATKTIGAKVVLDKIKGAAGGVK